MATGDLHEATVGDSTDVYYVDTGLYGIPEFNSVYILDTDRPALVETGIGTETDLVLDALAELGIEPADLSYILLTHVHLDHAGGAGSLAAVCPEATVCVHEVGARHIVDPDRLWQGTKAVVGDQIQYYAEPEPVPAERVVELEDGDTIDLGDHALEVHHAPGHAFHQAVFYDPVNDGVFTADAAGINTPGLDGVHHTSPPSDFHLEECLADVGMLQEIDPAALYYTHFGDSEPDGLLAEYAEVLEAWIDRVAQKRAELGDDEAVERYFAARARTVEAWGEEKARAEERMNVRGALQYLDERDAGSA